MGENECRDGREYAPKFTAAPNVVKIWTGSIIARTSWAVTIVIESEGRMEVDPGIQSKLLWYVRATSVKKE